MKHSLSRTLPGFKTRVRYEFNRLESNCTWSRPYQLAPAFREAESVDSRRSFVARKFSRDTSCSPIDAAMKYYDKTQFGRDRTPGDPQRFYNVNSLVWRCGAAGVRALPVLTAHDISLPEQ